MVGFLLSPLSWWNDAVINLPIALAFAWMVALFYQPAFGAALVVGYWLTNILGLMLMHKGARVALGDGLVKAYARKDLIKDLLISGAYTLVIIALVKARIIQPLSDYKTNQSYAKPPPAL